MSTLSQLLDRLRRVRLPPGGAAGAVAVPAAGDQLSGEVAFLFGELDQIQQRSELIVSAAHADAARIEAAAEQRRASMVKQARADGERIAAELLAERGARCERQVRELVDEAERAAARVLAAGRERTPALAELVVSRLLEDGL